MADYNTQYRDSVFRSYFNEPTRLLSLCNAVLDTQYIDPNKLNINTLNGIFFDKQKNDISCTIDDHFLVLIEHQSTVNENMPFRCLSYITELLNNMIKDKNRLYYKRLIKFPSPKFFVLYNGDEKEPLQRTMRLSDAFDNDSTSLELVVNAFNINYGLPQPLLQKCPYLFDYATLVGRVKEGIRAGLSRREAITRTVTFCIEHGIMGNYLVEHSEEVFNMLTLEWNMDDALQARFDEGFDEGHNLAMDSVARNMLRSGMTFDKIQELTQLSFERIQDLKNTLVK
ncbi:MAG: Rpn family recombination-promoting nuclease/putative transposase [Desulfovibrio sp.]|nr:Rpn family recombination-promoting nuclease/putative transposase [Desulfovibrio sp.]